MEAVNNNRLIVVKALKEMGADVYLKCDGSLTLGNALNLAKNPEMLRLEKKYAKNIISAMIL